MDYLTVAVAAGAVLTKARRRVPRVLCPHEEARRVLAEDTIANTQETEEESECPCTAHRRA